MTTTLKKLAMAAVAWSGMMLWAAPPLSTVRNTIYRANGSPFTGKIIIDWRSFEASDTSFIAKNQLELQITDGFLNARLVPTTTAAGPAYYRVRYFSSNGTIEFSEAWAVPASRTASCWQVISTPSQTTFNSQPSGLWRKRAPSSP